ncbi:MAG: HipA domain-containing protein [Cyclobacteriaceae bacterium]
MERRSGDSSKLVGLIPSLSKKHYRIIKGTSVGGDAPKELLRVYEYEEGLIRANKPKRWPIYITKTGHKWYPYESITEHLLNRIGQVIGLVMAESQLMFVNGQLRFMSKLFRHDRDQMLVHGADIYSGYLGDRVFVEEVEERQMARHFFTLTFTFESLKALFPHQADDIFLDFSRMLVFDAIVGNNDRHFYNWGILKHLRDSHQPRFSPIYDTARALFWNRSERHFSKYKTDPNSRITMLKNYVSKSKPKTGVEKNEDANHQDIIRLLYSNKFNGTKSIVNELVTEANRIKIIELIHGEFGEMLSEPRKSFITECINLRFQLLKEVMQ